MLPGEKFALPVTVQLTRFAKRQSTRAFVIRAIWHTLCYFDNREQVLIIRDVYDDITGTPARTQRTDNVTFAHIPASKHNDMAHVTR